MHNYHIITDSACDLPKNMVAELGITVVPLYVTFRNECLCDSVDEGIQTIYNGLRAGENASTSAINPTRWAEAMEPALKEGKDVLVVAFSSGLSTTYQSAVIAAEELKETYPDRTVLVVDGLAASLGQGLLVWYACHKRDEGLSLAELAAWIEDNKQHICHWFTVDDLMFLKRGGRVSAATALVGTMLSIKPVLHVDDEGHLINVGKVRGRKAAIKALADKVGELGAGYDNSTVFISHGDCADEAQILADMLKEKYGVKEVVLGYVGAVIGSHSGPGTIALFFLGDHR